MTTTRFVNPIIPEEELKQLDVVLKEFEKLGEIHINNSPNHSGVDDIVNRIHMLVYLDVLKNVVRSMTDLKGFVNTTREEFISLVTDEGKVRLNEVEKALLMKSLFKL